MFEGSTHILLVTQDHMQSLKIVAYLLLGYFWLVEEEEELLIIEESLASAEVSAEAVAKADQYHFIFRVVEESMPFGYCLAEVNLPCDVKVEQSG